MRRMLLVALATLGVPSVGGGAEPAAPARTTLRMAVQPMDAPTPALKYQLLPELSEMSHGNPVQGYLACFSEENQFFFSKQSMDDRDKWLAMPLARLRLENLRRDGDAPLARADLAARLDRPDWQCLAETKSNGLFALHRDSSQMQTLSYALKVRFRAEIADQRFDNAIATAKTVFALSRDLGEQPDLTGGFTGISIAESAAIEPLEEMVQQRGCPNLYWALTSLPSPLVSIRLGLQGERVLLAPHLAALNDRAPMTDAELRTAVAQVARVKQAMEAAESPNEKEVRDWLGRRVSNQAYVSSARKRLAEAGVDPERLKQFPPPQVLLLDEKLGYEARCDDAVKLMLLPYWEAERSTKRASAGTAAEGMWLLGDSTRSIVGVRRIQARLEQRIGLLRCVEALRMYAAKNGGKLPAQLSDVGVPVPIDPFTGREFIYIVQGAKATIRGSPPTEKEHAAPYNRAYEVTVQK